MPSNKDEQMFSTNGQQERITRLCAVALTAIQEDPEYLADDKVAVLIHNDVTKSEWGKTEAGMGFWNFDNPKDLIESLLMHLQVIGDQYGHAIGVVEARMEPVRMKTEDILGMAIARALARMEQEEGNAPDQSGTS